MENKLSKRFKRFILNCSKCGMNTVEMALYLCNNKDIVTYEEYRMFTKWIKRNEKFYYWLRSRRNEKYGN